VGCIDVIERTSRYSPVTFSGKETCMLNSYLPHNWPCSTCKHRDIDRMVPVHGSLGICRACIPRSAATTGGNPRSRKRAFRCNLVRAGVQVNASSLALSQSCLAAKLQSHSSSCTCTNARTTETQSSAAARVPDNLARRCCE
jgi:hypothetical protein